MFKNIGEINKKNYELFWEWLIKYGRLNFFLLVKLCTLECGTLQIDGATLKDIRWCPLISLDTVGSGGK